MRDRRARQKWTGPYLAFYATAVTTFALWNVLDGGNDAATTSRTVRLVASSAAIFIGLAIAWFAGRVWQSRIDSPET